MSVQVHRPTRAYDGLSQQLFLFSRDAGDAHSSTRERHARHHTARNPLRNVDTFAFVSALVVREHLTTVARARGSRFRPSAMGAPAKANGNSAPAPARGAGRVCAGAIEEDPSTLIPCPVITSHPNGFIERVEPNRETHEVRCVAPRARISLGSRGKTRDEIPRAPPPPSPTVPASRRLPLLPRAPRSDLPYPFIDAARTSSGRKSGRTTRSSSRSIAPPRGPRETTTRATTTTRS